MILTSFILFMMVFLLIGVASIMKSRNTTEDYLIAGKSVSPFLVGLSAVASNCSGFMFIGMIGFTYLLGLSSIWLMLGWVAGDLVANLLTIKRIQRASRAENVHSFGGLLAHWHGTDYRVLRVIVGVITVLFLTVYAAAQLKAGSKATASLLEWSPETGIILSAAIVLVYSMVGGIRASIWTDVAQAFVMITGMGLLVIMGLHYLGGVGAALESLASLHKLTHSGGELVRMGTDTNYMDWLPAKGSTIGGLLFIAGWFLGGINLGQPHVAIRFMSLDDEKNINRMRLYYYTWYLLFYAATITVGLLARLIIPAAGGFDAELALPNMALELFPQIFVGLILAAMFAATMSTADSQILACSAAVTRDIYQKEHHSLWATKLATFSILMAAVAIALSGNKTVFALVMDAWAMLSSAFVPLIIVYSLGKKVSEPVAIGMLFVGLLTCTVWNLAGLDSVIYSAAPGIVSGFVFYLLFGGISYRRDAQAP